MKVLNRALSQIRKLLKKGQVKTFTELVIIIFAVLDELGVTDSEERMELFNQITKDPKIQNSTEVLRNRAKRSNQLALPE